MTDDNGPNGPADDDSYVLEDTGGSIQDIEHEMELAAQEAAGAAKDAGPTAEKVDQELRDVRDRYLRTLADFENYRKRADREKTDFFKYALAGAIKELLPVLDNFDRALDHAEQGDEFHKGVLLIYKQLFDVLRRHGLKPIDDSSVHFDPNIHEAVVTEENPSLRAHTVIAILQKGYYLHDRLLRPALVKVAVGGPD